MKKYLFMIVTAFALAFTSCSDKEEIDINYFHDVTLSINCTKMYDSVKNDIEIFLGNNPSYSVEYTTFVYNDQKQLVKEDKQHSRLFETNVVLNGLQHGTYTFITTVSLAENKFSIWIYDKKENLNSIQVSTKPEKMNDGIEYYNSLGVSVQKIEVQDNVTVSITPELMGCYIELDSENVNKYAYPELLFTLKQAPTRLILNTFEQITEEILDDTTYWERGKLDLMKTDESQKMFLMQKGGINYGLGTRQKEDVGTNKFWIINKGKFNLEKGKYYKAFWYFKGKATLPENAFETYFHSIEKSDSCYKALDKEMNPLFKHPYTSWGSSVEDVKLFMDNNKYKLYQDIKYDEEEKNYYIQYYPRYLENSTYYTFETETSNLLNAEMIIDENNISLSDIRNEFEKNNEYIFFSYFENVNCYVYTNEKTIVYIYDRYINNNKYAHIIYQPNFLNETRTTFNLIDHIIHKKKKKNYKINLHNE